jgi:hypothetical protein
VVSLISGLKSRLGIDMAAILTLDSICPLAMVRAFPGVSSTWDVEAVQQLAIARVASYLNIPVHTIADNDNPFVEREITETLDGTGYDWLYMSMYPVISVSSIKLDNTTQDFTCSKRQADSVEVWIMDDPVIGKYCGYLRRKDNQIWQKGDNNYEITYTAGFATSGGSADAVAFPLGLASIIAELAALFVTNPQAIAMAKVDVVQYNYGLTKVEKVIERIYTSLDRYRRKPLL